MSIVPIFSEATKMQPADTALVEKAIWALRQRLRKQMNQLSGSFFDEVDDFVFEAGKMGQFAEGSDYLGAMREIRAKQVLFEESFLDTAGEYLQKPSTHADLLSIQSNQGSDSPVTFDSMELELAVGTMARKANKLYLPYMKQIETLNSAIGLRSNKQLISGPMLLSSTILGFIKAQALININLEIRLVFMKLFEQHFLMKVEKLFLDIISILNNIENRQFVERLYSSSSSFHMPVAGSCTPKKVTLNKSITDFQKVKPDTKAVESCVSDALQIVKDNASVPEFVTHLADQHWRMVMLLIGLNKGVSSLEWQEAEHVLQLLVHSTAGHVEIEEFDMSLLVEKINQGLRLLRLPVAEEERFTGTLKAHLAEVSLEAGRRKNGTSFECVSSIESEATVSPSGENILDASDLDEIAQLLSGEPINDDYAESQEAVQLMACLASVDRMKPCCAVKMLINDKPYDCVATRSGPNDNVYVIASADSQSTARKIAVTRSRLGLAISVSRGEIVLTEDAVKPSESNITVFEKKP